MKKEQFWKNFDLGTEVQLSGNFIYDGLHVFDQMEHFNHQDEIFEFLYFISVGIERLLKVDVILIEHSEESNQFDFDESLKTHSHTYLVNRINKKHKLNFGKVHSEFIQLLANFYRSFRYDRFNLINYDKYDQEKQALVSFIEKHLDLKISNEQLFVTQNDKRFKKFIGKVIGKIVSQLYELVVKEANRLNLYTYEIRTFSKAYKIFIENDYTFEKEQILQKEILIYLIKNELDSGFKDHINKYLPALEFENGSENDYSKCLFNLMNCRMVVDELDVLYEDVEDKKLRLGAIDVIGSDCIFEKDFDEEFDDI